jgi:catechol 2,3-dioxygenase-like lactoylglutathione lyase family enzyme
MDFRLEVVVLPVSDVDRAKAFYQGLGWRQDADFATGPAPEHQTYGSWVSFADPDGNSWFVQEVTTRLPGRATSPLAVFDSVAGLADALRRAEAAHGKYEQETGKADPDWPAWYARYMADEAAGPMKGEGGAGK